ncbi:MAG: hypothetical protein II393_04160 [Cytophagales bacterium]|nr:hypothetical protein [Cytophagales bacterium]
MYKYGMRLRPAGIGCQPKGFIDIEDVNKNETGYWSIVEYDRKLTTEEMNHYSMELIEERNEVKMVKTEKKAVAKATKTTKKAAEKEIKKPMEVKKEEKEGKSMNNIVILEGKLVSNITETTKNDSTYKNGKIQVARVDEDGNFELNKNGENIYEDIYFKLTQEKVAKNIKKDSQVKIMGKLATWKKFGGKNSYMYVVANKIELA